MHFERASSLRVLPQGFIGHLSFNDRIRQLTTVADCPHALTDHTPIGWVISRKIRINGIYVEQSFTSSASAAQLHREQNTFSEWWPALFRVGLFVGSCQKNETASTPQGSLLSRSELITFILRSDFATASSVATA